jgi:hypothetical protein
MFLSRAVLPHIGLVLLVRERVVRLDGGGRSGGTISLQGQKSSRN